MVIIVEYVEALCKNQDTIVTLALKYTFLYLSSFLTIVYIFCIGVNGMDMA